MKKLVIILLSCGIVFPLSAMEENHSNKRKAEEATEIEQINKKAKQAEKVVRVMVDNGNQTIVIPESLARMSRTFTDTIEDHPVVLGNQDNGEEIQLPQFKATEFNRLIQALKLVKEREEQQAFGIEKEKSILREDKHYVLETVYAVLDPILSPLNYQPLLEFLDLCNYLDIVDPAGSNFIVEAIMKELVKKYIVDKNIKLEDIAYPINFANEQVQAQFKQLFSDLLKDFHPLAQEYIILQRIGAPGKRDIADYLTLFEAPRIYSFARGCGINFQAGCGIKFIDTKLTSLKGIDLLPSLLNMVDYQFENSNNKTIKEINFSSNFITTIEKDAFISLPQLLTIILEKNNWLHNLQEGSLNKLEKTAFLVFLESDTNPSQYNTISIEKNSLPPSLKSVTISFTDFEKNAEEFFKQIPNADAIISLCNYDKKETIKELIRQDPNCKLLAAGEHIYGTVTEFYEFLQSIIENTEKNKEKWSCIIS